MYNYLYYGIIYFTQFNTYKCLHIYLKYEKILLNFLKIIYKPMVMCNVIFL